MQARFYMPWMGRFTSPDPARDQHFEDTQSWNIYSYVRNNPIMNTDPTGMIGEGNAISRSMSGSADHSWEMQNEEEKKNAQTGLQPNQNGVGVDGGTVKGQFSVDRLNPSANPDDKTTGRALYVEGQATVTGATGDIGVAKGDAKLVESKYFDLSFSTRALTAEGQATVKPSKSGDASGKDDKKGTLGVGVAVGGTATLAKAQFSATVKLGPVHLTLRGGFNLGVEGGFKLGAQKNGTKGGGFDIGAIFKVGGDLTLGN